MSFSQYIHVILNVIKDPKVIVTTILMIVIVSFAKFVTNYTKKKRPPRVKKEKTPKKSVPKPAEEKSEEESE